MLLRKQHPDVFEKLDGRLAAARAVPVKHVMLKGEHPSESLSCLLCGAQKHRHKWMLRDRRCSGATCYSCYRSSIILGVSRSVKIARETEALEVFKAMSRRVRLSLADKDECRCEQCCPRVLKK